MKCANVIDEIPFSQVAGISKVNGSVNLKYENARNMIGIRVLLYVPVNCGIGKVSKHKRPRPHNEQK